MWILSARGEFRNERAFCVSNPNPTANLVSVFKGTCVNIHAYKKSTHEVSFFSA